MKTGVFILIFCSLGLYTKAQLIVGSTTESRRLYKESQRFFQTKNYTSASLVLSEAVKLEPTNVVFLRDLALNYFLDKKYKKAQATIDFTNQLPDADVTCYALAFTIYDAIGDNKATKKILNEGLEKFPSSGELYNIKGNFLQAQNDYKEALMAWEKGIALDPQYRDNYYHAAKVYINSPFEIIKPLIYSEVFINLEPFTNRTEEMKRLLFDGYFKMAYFINNDTTGLYANSNPLQDFSTAVYSTFRDLKDVVSEPLDVHTIMQLRIRFLLDWNKTYDEVFPFFLFDWQNSLLISGNYEAYNQWLFGRESDTRLYQAWAIKNAKILNEFLAHINSEPIAPKERQFYFKNSLD